jgi:NTP pyrophosphatase (non-canonical NTP hydrolase)
MSLADVKRATFRPSGYRTLGYAEGEGPKAARFDYHGWKVWIPYTALVFAEGRFQAPLWAIESSKNYQSKREDITMTEQRRFFPIQVGDGPLNTRAAQTHLKNCTAGWWTALKDVPAISAGDALHGKRNVGELLMLCVSEVAEGAEGWRESLMDDKLPDREMIEVELADVVIRVLDLSGSASLDLDGATLDLQNAGLTEHLHGQNMEGYLLLLVCEFAAAMEGHRKSAPDRKLPQRQAFEVRLAAALLLVGEIAAEFELDVEGAIIEKEAFNAQREDHKLEQRRLAGGKAY